MPNSMALPEGLYSRKNRYCLDCVSPLHVIVLEKASYEEVFRRGTCIKASQQRFSNEVLPVGNQYNRALFNVEDFAVIVSCML